MEPLIKSEHIEKTSNENLYEKISELKEKLGAVILAHNYQLPEIQKSADFCGDSLELAKISSNLKEKVIVFCGVTFMAETAKILSPEKRVITPVPSAGCPLANMISPEEVLQMKKECPQAWVVSYVNSTAEVKALSDVCCTSSNAVTVVKNIPVDRVIFVPDRNLGWWVKRNVPKKEVIPGKSFCYVHEKFTLSDIEEARKNYPGAEIMVHPECRPEVLEAADVVLSTSGMLKRAKESSAQSFIIGTEEGLIHRLKQENPGKEFYPLGKGCICMDMKKTTIKDLYRALKRDQYEVLLPDDVIKKAHKALERMVRYN